MNQSKSLFIKLSKQLLPLLTIFFFAGIDSYAQETADKIIAIVGKSRIILQSDLQVQEAQLAKQYPDFNDSMRCLLLQQMIVQKVLVEQAERDSLTVSEEEIEGQIDNKVRYYMRAYGGKEQLEAAAGKTIYQLKDDYREFTKEELLAQRMKGDVLNALTVTPVEVRAFFKEAAQDTLPYFPGTVEVGQLVLKPASNAVLDKYAYDKLEGIRADVVKEGKSFEALASLYSDDPGSRDNGGDLGIITKGEMVPEFTNAAFKLSDGEISPIFKSNYGYHIIQMIKREGEGAHVRHILVKPEHAAEDYTSSLVRLDSIRSQIVSGKTSFAEAVGKFSADDQSKLNGGLIVNPNTNSSQLQVDELDPMLALMIDTLQVGSYSAPQIFVNPNTGEKATRIVFMRGRTEPHQANLTDDYSQIQELALERKKAKRMEDWVNEKIPSFYIKIDPSYASCSALKTWNTAKAP